MCITADVFTKLSTAFAMMDLHVPLILALQKDASTNPWMPSATMDLASPEILVPQAAVMLMKMTAFMSPMILFVTITLPVPEILALQTTNLPMKMVAFMNRCEDGHSCTTDCCAPEDENAVNACVHEAVHPTCDDEIPCTNDACQPDSEDADDHGCFNTVNNDVCNDDIECTEDICSPFRSAQMIMDAFTIQFILVAVTNTAVPLIFAHQHLPIPPMDASTKPITGYCNDGVRCTVDTCAPEDSDREDGCVFTETDSNCAVPDWERVGQVVQQRN